VFSAGLPCRDRPATAGEQRIEDSGVKGNSRPCRHSHPRLSRKQHPELGSFCKNDECPLAPIEPITLGDAGERHNRKRPGRVSGSGSHSLAHGRRWATTIHDKHGGQRWISREGPRQSAQSILVYRLIEVEARISECTGDTFAIFLRNADASSNFVPCAFDAIPHLGNNALGLIARKQEPRGL
jgi:hypothetical protein